MRADAQRNRLAILEAASALVLERGGEVPLEAVAARAGVGVGTLYRRFPDRGALFQALAHHTLARVEEAAQAAADPGIRPPSGRPSSPRCSRSASAR